MFLNSFGSRPSFGSQVHTLGVTKTHIVILNRKSNYILVFFVGHQSPNSVICRRSLKFPHYRICLYLKVVLGPLDIKLHKLYGQNEISKIFAKSLTRCARRRPSTWTAAWSRWRSRSILTSFLCSTIFDHSCRSKNRSTFLLQFLQKNRFWLGFSGDSKYPPMVLSGKVFLFIWGNPSGP